jgi:phosphoribosylamine--glycine ligase
MDSIIFHAGTTFDAAGEEVISSGGRVIAVTSFGSNMQEAFQRSYKNADSIKYVNKAFRKDLGVDLMRYI